MSRILIVDDSGDNRYLLQVLLTGLGYEVDAAGDGLEALETARARRPDLVVSDILMPRMDGFALCREWRADDRLKSVPFMFYTATYTQAEDEQFALALGADCFLVKPQEPEALARAVAEVLSGRGTRRGAEVGSGALVGPESEVDFLKRHRDAVVRKLEDKMSDLESANVALRADIAERERVEAGLRESEARFQSLAEASPVGIFQTNAEGMTTYVNRRWTEIAGMSARDALGNGWLGAVHPDDRGRVAAAWTTAASAGRRTSYSDYRFVRPDGSIAWVIGQAVATLDSTGKVTAYIGTITDITERVMSERALRDSEARYRELFERAPIGLYRTTPDGEILVANPTLVSMLGYESAEELRGLDLEAAGFAHDSPRERFKALLARDGVVRNLESRWERKDGTLLVVRETAHAVRGDGGDVLYYEGAVEDITERARAEEVQRRLAAAVDQAAEAVMITDSDGTIQYVNPAFTQITGYAPDEVLGQNPRLLKSGRQDEAFYREMWSALLERRSWSGHLVNRRKDGSHYEEEATITAVVDEAGAVVNFVAVKRDVTRERELRQQLEHAQRLEAVGRLAGGIAHDFNNLLQAMLSQAALLGIRLRGVAEAAKPLGELEQLIRRGAALTRQLLLFSRRQTAAREPADLNELVRNAAMLIRALVRENIAVVTELADEPLPILADRGQCDQVIMNLVVNASDAMPDGGTLTVRTEGDARTVRLSVIDTGHGVSDAVREHLFEPFFTTKPVGKGTGLGLSVVHGIVEAHGGSVAVSSREGEGATFAVTLPRRVGALAPAGEVEVPSRATTGHGELILVVEDEGGAREGLVEILRSLGYAVTAVASGEEALALAAIPAPDLLLTDLVLPGLPGHDLANRLRERWPAVEVVVMSGYAEGDALRHVLPAVGAAFLQKPFDIPTLAQTVRRMLDRARPAD